MANAKNKRPDMATHSLPCCGECLFCARDGRDGKVKCFLNPPSFEGFDGEDPLFVRPEVDTKDPACQYIKRSTS